MAERLRYPASEAGPHSAQERAVRYGWLAGRQILRPKTMHRSSARQHTDWSQTHSHSWPKAKAPTVPRIGTRPSTALRNGLFGTAASTGGGFEFWTGAAGAVLAPAWTEIGIGLRGIEVRDRKRDGQHQSKHEADAFRRTDRPLDCKKNSARAHARPRQKSRKTNFRKKTHAIRR